MEYVKIKHLLTILLIGIIGISYSQTDTLNRTDKFGKKYGYWKKYSTNKVLEYEGRFYNGEPVGEFIHYHPNGKIKNISYFKPNSPIVTTTLYHENGTRYAEGAYWNKIKDGQWLYYNSSGQLIAEENYNKGMLHGVSKIYSAKDGSLLEETNWVNGLKHGMYTNYYTNGALRTKMFYSYNKMHGSFENYYENGKLKNKGTYAKDFRKGKWVNYNENGKELKIEYFDKGITTAMFMGFQTQTQWIILNVDTIAYFYQKTPKTVIIQLKDSSQISIYDDIMRISKCATVEYFIFVNEIILSSYDALKKLIPHKTNPNQAKVLLLYPPDFEVYTYDEYYKLLKAINNPKPPTAE